MGTTLKKQNIYIIYRMPKQKTIQSHYHNYLSEIWGDIDKLLEYISKTGEILKQYYFSDDAQK